MKKLTVQLGERSYPVVIGRNLLSSIGSLLRARRVGKKIFVVTNRKIKSGGFLKPVKSSLKAAGFEVFEYLLRHGDERDKSKDSLFGLWQHMAESGLERSSAVLALGGGVVGDVAAFAASTYMRGIPLIQVPTTLLAQVDAAIGGKTAIDLPLAKNIVGTFYQPCLVVIDVATLKRMGRTSSGMRELKNSFAEIIKYGIISDTRLFRLLEEKVDWFFRSARKKPLGQRELSFLETLVWRSVRVKARVVEADERETKGRRMILNYGHTFAHAFEAASHYRMPHGEAVALGMVLAARLARRREMWAAKEEERQSRLIQKVGLAPRISKRRFHLHEIIRPMFLDKKAKAGRPCIVLPVAIGRVKVVEDVSLSEVKEVLRELGVK